MTNFNERTNTLLYKNISPTLYSRKSWCWFCVRGELETGTDCCIMTQSSSDHSSTSLSWLGLLNRGSVCKLILTVASSPQLTPTPPETRNDPKPSVAPGYIIVLRTPASAVPPLFYTAASLDWWLGRGSIYNITTQSLHLSKQIWKKFILLFSKKSLFYSMIFIYKIGSR